MAFRQKSAKSFDLFPLCWAAARRNAPPRAPHHQHRMKRMIKRVKAIIEKMKGILPLIFLLTLLVHSFLRKHRCLTSTSLIWSRRFVSFYANLDESVPQNGDVNLQSLQMMRRDYVRQRKNTGGVFTERESLSNFCRRTVNVRRSERARKEGST